MEEIWGGRRRHGTAYFSGTLSVDARRNRRAVAAGTQPKQEACFNHSIDRTLSVTFTACDVHSRLKSSRLNIPCDMHDTVFRAQQLRQQTDGKQPKRRCLLFFFTSTQGGDANGRAFACSWLSPSSS